MYLEEKKTGEALMRDVLEWLKQRNPKEYYDWSDEARCACAKYAKEKGRLVEWGRRCVSDDATWSILNEIADSPHEWTMGNFASNLEKALA